MKKTLVLLILLVVSIGSAGAQWSKTSNGVLGKYDLGYGGAMGFKDGIVWVGVTDLFNSRDSGITWNLVTTPFAGHVISDICFFSKDTGAVAVNDLGIYITNNAGKDWQQVLSIGSCLSVAFTRTGKEFFVADRDNYSGTASYTSDGGTTWARQSVEGGGGGAYQALYNPNSGTGYILSRSVSPNRASHISVSTDFGKTWKRAAGNVDLDSYSFALDSCDQNKVYIINEEYNELKDGQSEVFVTLDNGKTWTINEQQTANFFSSACSSTPNAIYIGSSLGGGVFRSTDHGTSWATIGGPASHQDSRLVCAINDNIVIAADEDGSIWRTTNSGGDPISTTITSPNVSLKFTSARILNDTVGATVRLPIYLHHTGKLSSIDMVVHFPDGPLVYLGSFLYYGKSIDVSGSRSYGRFKLHIDADDLNALTDSLVGYAVFKWYPIEFFCAEVVFDSISMSVRNTICDNAHVAIVDSCNGFIDGYRFCDPLARVNGRTGAPNIDLFTFAPNPARQSSALYSSLYNGRVDLSIFDLTGKFVKQIDGTVAPDAPLSLSLEDLASGSYYMTISGVNILPYQISFVHFH